MSAAPVPSVHRDRLYASGITASDRTSSHTGLSWTLLQVFLNLQKEESEHEAAKQEAAALAVLEKKGFGKEKGETAASEVVALDNPVFIKQGERPPKCPLHRQILLLFWHNLFQAVRFPELWFWSVITPTVLIIISITVIFDNNITNEPPPRLYLSPGLYGA